MADPDYVIVNSSEVEDDEKAQHDTPTRKALRKAARVFKGKIPRKELFSKYGVSERTGFRTLAAKSSHSRHMNSGTKRKLSTEKLREIIDWIKGRFERRAMTWDLLIAEFELHVSAQTLQRGCHRLGYRRCRACWRRYLRPEVPVKRREFCRDHAAWQEEWKDIRFSDETHFSVGQEAQAYVTRFYDERHEPDCCQGTRLGKRNLILYG